MPMQDARAPLHFNSDPVSATVKQLILRSLFKLFRGLDRLDP